MQNTHNSILLLVEGHTDKMVVENILIAAHFPLERVEIKTIGSKQKVKNFLKKHTFLPTQKVTILVDSDEIFTKNAQKKEQEMIEGFDAEIFFAVEEIESWILSDINLLQSMTDKEEIKNRISHLPLPEEILYPKVILQHLIHYNEKYFDYTILQRMNITAACARNQSLRDFLSGMARILNIEFNDIENAISLNINLKIFSNILKEVFDKQQVMYKTLNSYQYTAEDMVKNIEEGSELGRTYVADLLRISRDLLKRQAQKI